jgi:predicted nuclease of predicted toxin-antitoxin system
VKVRFQADADLNEDIVKGVLRREPELDFRTATVAGFRSLSDLEVLTLAARENRVLVTHDRKTMPRAFADFIRENSSPGLLVVSQKTDLLSVIEGVLLVWLASDAKEWRNQICTIPF